MRSFTLIGLLAALSATPALASPTAPLVVAKDGVEVTIVPAIAPAAGPEALSEAVLDVEARSEEAARRLGFRSLHAVTTIDCRQGANRFTQAEAYAQGDLQGDARPWHVSGEWIHPADGSFMSAVTGRICAAAAVAATAPAMIVTQGVDTNAPAPPGPPGAASVSPAAPQAASAPASVKIAPPASTELPGLAVAQVAASPSASGARRVLDALKSLIASPLAGSVEPATVHGVQVYRANVSGFASTADARAFCVRASRVASTCWVRLSAAAPAGTRRS